MLLPNSLRVALVTLAILGQQATYAQCESDGDMMPTIASNNSSEGSVGWSATQAIMDIDSDFSTAISVLPGNNTNLIMASGFDLNIPEDAIICGITVNIEKRSGGFLPLVRDRTIRLVKNGSMVGANQATNSAWTETARTTTYGGPNESWSESWTPEDVNNSNFGVAISARLNGYGLFPYAQVGNVNVSVNYNIIDVLPIELSEFGAERRAGRDVEVQWSTASETNNEYFVIERSTDGYDWEARGTIPGSGNSTNLLEYDFTDLNEERITTYYRLKQVDFDGEYSYSDVVAVGPANISSQAELLAYPNPSKGRFNVQSVKGLQSINLYDLNGRLIMNMNGTCGDNGFSKEFSVTQKGTYFLRAIDCQGNPISERVVVN